ncbi:myoglobin [Callorhinchus milii]|uniref:Myoglobin n=1 Tax=Callorhinchus milii TaxID=7868 RepID=K4G616_CALMI|nr:myoglobin [Callorhinchus milii]AFK11040.1 Myoglobin [Callorhinchus milii]AFM87064.1 Myoglobin [Callorhinchus milii]AFM87072.1 Myoglobin [Callorhinchus milii]AFM87103.1 Myoglobin [Callorhinchus milii]AFM87114.1 Myoglobin [Callorhinchus milii]|eukprot:gi/632986475/ref/XP_007910259.1/ PREDICTED: myoglobin-like [Callorhinchus milii]
MCDWDLINKVWAKVEEDLAGNGQTVLLRLFEEHPETKAHFPKFKDIPLGQLTSNADVKTHGNTVFKALGDVVKQKGKHASNLQALATTHINKHKIPPQNFTLITNVILKVFAEKFPGEMTAPAQEAFSKAFKAICSELEDLYKKGGFQS